MKKISQIFNKNEKSFTFCLTKGNIFDNIKPIKLEIYFTFSKLSEETVLVKKLSNLFIGEIGVVKKVYGENKIKRRLFDMGITPGTEIYLRKKAPLGDPLEITLRGYELTLRKTEADCIEMEDKK